jgi:hypothetical protein
MAKPEAADFIQFTFKVTPEEAGKWIVILTNGGVGELHQEVVTNVVTFNKRASHKTKAEDFLKAWLVDHPTFKAKEAIDACRADGRNAAAGYRALRILTDEKILRRLGEGNYQRADVKHLAAPKAAKTAKTAARDRHEVDHREFILRYGRQHQGRFSLAKLKAHFEAHGRKPSSVGGAVNILTTQKKIKRVGEGEYVLLNKAAPKSNAKPVAPKIAAALPVTEIAEAAHG